MIFLSKDVYICHGYKKTYDVRFVLSTFWFWVYLNPEIICYHGLRILSLKISSRKYIYIVLWGFFMLYVYFLKRIILVCLYFSPSLFISPFYLVSYYCCLMEGPQDKCFEVPEKSKSYKYQITNKYPIWKQ